MTQGNEARYFLTYTGSGVTELKDAGVFASGTSAWVSEAVARTALAAGGSWAVKDPSGKQLGSMPAPEAPRPAPAAAAPHHAPAAPKHEEKKPEKHEEKKAEKHDDHKHDDHKHDDHKHDEKKAEEKKEDKPAEAAKA